MSDISFAAQSSVVVPPQLPDIDCPEDEGVFLDHDDLSAAQDRIKEWITLDDEISKLSAAIRQRRKQKKALDEHITQFMQSNKIPHFELTKGKLSVAVSNRKQGLNHKWIMEQMKAHVADQNLRAKIENALQDRPMTQVSRLKHSKPRASRARSSSAVSQDPPPATA